MRTAAQLLKRARNEKGLTLKQVSQETKIPLAYLKLIESSDYHLLPDESYTKLYIREYASFLGLSPEAVISFFRRDLSVICQPDRRRSEKKGRFSFKLWREKSASLVNNFSFGPGAIKTLGVGIIVFLLALYLVRQYLIFNSPPRVSIALFCFKKGDQAWVRVEGETDPEATVKIGDVPVSVDSDGAFRERVMLVPGQKEIKIWLQSPVGKVREVVKLLDCQN